MFLFIALIVYTVLHVIICILIYFGVRSGTLKFSEQLMPIIALVPFAGVAIAICADYDSRHQKVGSKPIALEEIHAGLEDFRMNKPNEVLGEQEIVPLEEAMAVNDPNTRRKLVLDILRQDTASYTKLLLEATMDDDIEVSHYASTALMELQREYELALQKADADLKEDPDNPQYQAQKMRALENMLGSGLVDEEIKVIHLRQYIDLAKIYLESHPEDMFTMIKVVKYNLELKQFAEASALADKMIVRWPNREEVWISKLETCYKSGDMDGFQKAIARMRADNVYLTPESRQLVEFWEG